MTNILYGITAKLHCNQEATAFLINEKLAITARHAVIDHIEKRSKISLKFFIETCYENNTVNAKVLDSSKQFDIAILELEQPCTHITEFVEISSQRIEKSDQWEAVGFPLNWNESKEGDQFCFLRGDIYRIHNQVNTVYDVHLSSKYIKEEWDYDFKGLSGAAILIDEKIKGIVISEEYSLIKSPLKIISINKIVDFLNENNIKTGQTFGVKTNLINKRLDQQKFNCENLFKKVEYRAKNADVDFQINSYHIKYNDHGKVRLEELSDYLAGMIIDYACSLEDIFQSKNSSDNRKMLETFNKTMEVIENIKENEKLGSLLLWMILEGVIGAPKALKRINMEDENDLSLSEVHIGLSSDQKLVLYIGDGILKEDLNTAVVESINIMKYLPDFEKGIFVLDEYILEQMDGDSLKDLLVKFKNPNRKWEDVTLELSIFTGYNSALIKQIESRKYPKNVIEQIINEKYIQECLLNEEIICKIIAQETCLEKVNINWFTLPFSSIMDFEQRILDDLKKGGMA
ncbi:Hachiman antiphage defense system protein HamA [Metabacillus indicus]|uniref:Hachiman antiphage defense system protein HamA n=1 Tax=Metabacillus indicus TaxID=246786 RepID=UPI003CF6082F